MLVGMGSVYNVDILVTRVGVGGGSVPEWLASLCLIC